MRTSELDYELPERAIAFEPAGERDASRLLVLRRAPPAIEHRGFRDLPRLLRPGDLLVRNVSRVLPARLVARRASGGKATLLLVDALDPDRWRALARPAGRLRAGETLRLESGFEIAVRPEADGWVELSAPGLTEEIEKSGMAPLPPYIRRAPTVSDRERYQTVYARDPGSVAAPTAGLHFTPGLLAELTAAGVALADVTLHIGPGTFLPVRAGKLEEHRMHAESYWVPEGTVAAVYEARQRGGRIVAVGTSALRALEAAAAGGELAARQGRTDLFIRPGFTFRVASALITNFHQPRSTLLALVAALAGVERVLAAYAQALERDYRFLSYGDAMLVL